MVYEIKQNGGVQQALKVVNSSKPYLSKVLLLIKKVRDIVTIAKISESNVLANLTTQLSPPINLPIVCENPKVTESNTSKIRTSILQLIMNLLKHL